MATDTIGSIATHIVENIGGIPAGVSGNMVEIVDLARQHVANWTNQIIGSNSIGAKFQPAITDFAKADAVDLSNAGAGGDQLKLSDLSIGQSAEAMTGQQYRIMADMKLKTIGRSVQFARSIS